MIPQETVQKIIDAADIVEVVGDFVNLHKSGSSYKGLCPFHNEKTPSFMVSPAKQIFKCFGCGEAGSPVSFVMKHEAMSFVESLKWLAHKYNIEIQEKELSPEELAALKENDTIYTLNTFAQKHFTENLTQKEEGINIGLSYFKNRGFTDETISKFQLGYTPDKKDDFVETAIKKGYKPELIEKGGLASSKTNDSVFSNKTRYYDRFRARVMFPIHSLSGQIIAFGGRTLRTDKNIAKYINSPETPVYNKSKSLYGIFYAKNEIVKKDKCYLVEGYTDVISMHQSGIKNVVASSGTSLTEEQIRIIRRFTPNLTLIFDGDAAGLKAAQRGIDLSLKEDMNVRLVTLQQGEDPDSFCKSNPISEINEYFSENEKDFILFKIDLIQSEDLLDPIKKSAAIKDVIKTIAIIPDELKRDNYIKATSRLLSTSEDIIYSEINKILKNDAANQNKKQNVNALQEKKTPEIPRFIDETSLPEEKQLIYFLIKFGDQLCEDQNSVANFIITELETEGGFRNIVFRDVFEIYRNNLEEFGVIDTKIFLAHENDKIRKIVENILSNDYQLSNFWEKNGNHVLKPEETYKKDVKKTIIAFKIRIIELFLKKIHDEISTPNLTEDEILSKMQMSQTAINARLQLMEIGGIRHIY